MEKIDQVLVAKLVERTQQGDTEAFGELYDILLTPIYRYIFYKVQNQETAEDLTEEAFLKAWQNISKYKVGKHPFTAWLYRIAHNVTIDYFRSHEEVLEINEEIFDDRKGLNPMRDTELFYNEKELSWALSRLPEVQKQVIILRYINELSNTEISEIVGKSELAIRIIHSRSLKALRELLEPRNREKK